MSFVRFTNVSFTYEKAREPLFQDLNLHFTGGWTGVVGANGVGKTTLLELATGSLTPGSGKVSGVTHAVYCAQRTDQAPQDFQAFLKSPHGARLRGVLGVDQEWINRWDSLSHGERKRAQIGAALWREPDLLVVDEPTNHLDQKARNLLFRALRDFRGVGVMVSHDRDLLDRLCENCLFLSASQAVIRPGNYSEGMTQAQLERDSQEREYEAVRSRRLKMEKEAKRRKAQARGSKKRMSKKGLSRKDHDGKSKLDAARLTGKDGRAGRLQKQLESRLEKIREQEVGLQGCKDGKNGIWMPGCRSTRKHLFYLPPGAVSLGHERKLVWPALHMAPGQRIGLSGPNGFGKSTFLRHLRESWDLPENKVVYLPQEVTRDQGRALLDEIRKLDGPMLGRLMTVVDRLGSHPSRLLASHAPSPGEIRKLMLAMGICQEPHLIVMDEPTNHLDLPSVSALEQALADCPCGLILVSHDHRFLEALTETRWTLGDHGGGEIRLEENSRVAWVS